MRFRRLSPGGDGGELLCKLVRVVADVVHPPAEGSVVVHRLSPLLAGGHLCIVHLAVFSLDLKGDVKTIDQNNDKVRSMVAGLPGGEVEVGDREVQVVIAGVCSY